MHRRPVAQIHAALKLQCASWRALHHGGPLWPGVQGPPRCPSSTGRRSQLLPEHTCCSLNASLSRLCIRPGMLLTHVPMVHADRPTVAPPAARRLKRTVMPRLLYAALDGYLCCCGLKGLAKGKHCSSIISQNRCCDRPA